MFLTCNLHSSSLREVLLLAPFTDERLGSGRSRIAFRPLPFSMTGNLLCTHHEYSREHLKKSASSLASRAILLVLFGCEKQKVTLATQAEGNFLEVRWQAYRIHGKGGKAGLDTSWKQGRSEESGTRIQEKLGRRVACQDSPSTGMSWLQTFAAFPPVTGITGRVFNRPRVAQRGPGRRVGVWSLSQNSIQ